MSGERVGTESLQPTPVAVKARSFISDSGANPVGGNWEIASRWVTVMDFTELSGNRNLHTIRAIEIENALLGTLPTTDNAEASATPAQPTTGRTVNIAALAMNRKFY